MLSVEALPHHPFRPEPPVAADVTLSDRDTRLAALLDELARARAAGREPDVDAAARRHPDLAAELRQLWAAAQLADALARTHNPGEFTPRLAPTSPPPRPFG